jgi:hypothetical protein
MQTSKRILDDLAKVASGAASVFAGIKEEVETLVHQRLERALADLDVVPRDEFEAVKAVAAKARSEQEKLAGKVARLETLMGVKTGGETRGKGKSAAAKPAFGTRPAAKARASGTGTTAQPRKTSRRPVRRKK